LHLADDRFQFGDAPFEVGDGRLRGLRGGRQAGRERRALSPQRSGTGQ
jgi:hypothetical protein